MGEQVGACKVFMYTGLGSHQSVKDDGTNTTVTLEAGAGSDIHALTFQYRVTGTPTWNTIGAGANDNGAFKLDWAVPNAILGVSIDLRAIGDTVSPGAPGCAAPGTEQSSNVQTTVVHAASEPTREAEELTTADNIGVFQAPTGFGGGQWVAINGTTSAPDGSNVFAQAVGDGPFASGQQIGATKGGKFNVAFDMNLFAGYVWDATAPAEDQLTFFTAVDHAGNGLYTDDVETYNVYKQVLTDLTATPTGGNISDAPGATKRVTLKAVDQFGKPIAGAQIFTTSPAAGPLADVDTGATVTDGNGELTVLQGQGTIQYYVNATNTPGYNGAVGDQEATVTFTPYAPHAADVKFTSHDSTVFDRDEYADGDLRAQVLDQSGEAFAVAAPQALKYRWTVTPFDGSAVRKSGWFTAPAGGPDQINPSTFQVHPLQTVPFDVDHPPADPGIVIAQPDIEGTWELETELVGDGGGNNAIAKQVEAPTVKSGEANVKFDDLDPTWADVNTTATVTGSLTLDDGTALPARNMKFTWTPGPAATAPFGDPAPDATLVGGNGQIKKTDANGKFSVDVKDIPDGTSLAEIGGRLDAQVQPTLPQFGNNTDNSKTHGVDFVTTDMPADGTITMTDLGSTLPPYTGDSPGRLKVVKVHLEDAFHHALPGRKVNVTVDHGFFLNIRSVAGGTIPEIAALADPNSNKNTDFGGWKNEGGTTVTTTDAAGDAFVVLSIGRDAGFDDDGKVKATVTGTISGKSATQALNWDTINGDGDDSLNISSINVVRTSPQAATDPAQTGDSVLFDLYAKDQFGNLVQGILPVLSCTDTTGSDHPCPAFTFNSGPGVVVGSDFDNGGDLWVLSPVPGTYHFNAHVEYTQGTEWETGPTITNDVAGKTLAEEGDVKDAAFQQEWYSVDLAGSTYEMTADPNTDVEPGTPVTVTVTAKDQKGNPLPHVQVEFVRNGDNDTETTVDTDVNGVATYVYEVEDTCLVDHITAVLRDNTTADGDPADLGVVRNLETTVTSACSGDPIAVSLTGKSSFNKRGKPIDVMKISATVPGGSTSQLTGAGVHLMAKIDGVWKEIGKGDRVLDSDGKVKFFTRDRTPHGGTKYQAFVDATDTTQADHSQVYKQR